MKKKGKLIKSIDELANQFPSVWVILWNKPSPMAFIDNLQFRLIKRWIKNEYIYTIKEDKDGKK